MAQDIARIDNPQSGEVQHIPPSNSPLQDMHRIMPVFSVQDAVYRRQVLIDFVNAVMTDGTDYGKIEGTGDKKTLLKPGAEKLCTLFGLTSRFELVDKVEDWSGELHNGEPFFYYSYRCQLYRGDYLITESDGSCNSWEKKYRWRQGQRLCPVCNQPTVFKSKTGPGFFCWEKKGGCGEGFKADDARIATQGTGRIPNPDVADQVNTIQKMAQKRSLVAATLLAVNASEYFTQDLEDFDNGHHPAPSQPAQQRATQPAQAKSQFDEAKTREEILKTDITALNRADLEKLIKNEWRVMKHHKILADNEAMIEHLRGFAFDGDWEVEVINKLADVEDMDQLKDYALNIQQDLKQRFEEKTI